MKNEYEMVCFAFRFSFEENFVFGSFVVEKHGFHTE